MTGPLAQKPPNGPSKATSVAAVRGRHGGSPKGICCAFLTPRLPTRPDDLLNPKPNNTVPWGRKRKRHSGNHHSPSPGHTNKRQPKALPLVVVLLSLSLGQIASGAPARGETGAPAAPSMSQATFSGCPKALAAETLRLAAIENVTDLAVTIVCRKDSTATIFDNSGRRPPRRLGPNKSTFVLGRLVALALAEQQRYPGKVVPTIGPTDGLATPDP